ncbi:unnamed protein product [Sympodiomycopsis kandeliae]
MDTANVIPKSSSEKTNLSLQDGSSSTYMRQLLHYDDQNFDYLARIEEVQIDMMKTRTRILEWAGAMGMTLRQMADVKRERDGKQQR